MKQKLLLLCICLFPPIATAHPALVGVAPGVSQACCSSHLQSHMQCQCQHVVIDEKRPCRCGVAAVAFVFAGRGLHHTKVASTSMVMNVLCCAAWCCLLYITQPMARVAMATALLHDEDVCQFHVCRLDLHVGRCREDACSISQQIGPASVHD